MVIIIGATGFIGMYTTERFLQEGYQVFATGRNKVMMSALKKMGAFVSNMDITCKEDFQKLPTEDIEGVILLAGMLPANEAVDVNQDENAAEYFRINVEGTINVLEFCRKHGIKKVISCCSYSDVRNAWKKGVALRETEPRNFQFTGDHTVYVISKNAANDVMEYYNQQHGMQCASFRFPPVYGVGPHSVIYVNGKYYKSGIQTFIENAQSGRDIEIWGDPHISRDIIYVKDVAIAFVKALQSEKTKGLYNMTSGTELDLEEQAKAVIQVFGDPQKSRIVYRPDIPNNTPSFLFDMSKAKDDFGFIPQYKSYIDIMNDYKKELESGRWDEMLASRNKSEV